MKLNGDVLQALSADAFRDPIISGWLVKEAGSALGRARDRFFCCSASALFYYASADAGESVVGAFLLEGATALADGEKPITPSAKKLELTNDDGSAAAVVDVLVVGVSA